MLEEEFSVSLAIIISTIGFLVFVAGLVGFVFLYYQKLADHQKELLNKEEEKNELRIKALLQGQENERRRIGMELHDGIGMELAALKLYLSLLELKIKDNSDALEQHKQVYELTDTTLTNVRNLSHSMLPDFVAKNGLVQTIKSTVEVLKQTTKIEVELIITDTPLNLKAEQELMIFRIMQELIQNAVKHSELSKLTITLKNTGQGFEITVADNGKGFNTRNVAGLGVGLQNIRSRAEIAGCTFQLNSEISRGTTAKLVFLTPPL